MHAHCNFVTKHGLTFSTNFKDHKPLGMHSTLGPLGQNDDVVDREEEFPRYAVVSEGREDWEEDRTLHYTDDVEEALEKLKELNSRLNANLVLLDTLATGRRIPIASAGGLWEIHRTPMYSHQRSHVESFQHFGRAYRAMLTIAPEFKGGSVSLLSPAGLCVAGKEDTCTAVDGMSDSFTYQTALYVDMPLLEKHREILPAEQVEKLERSLRIFKARHIDAIPPALRAGYKAN